MVSSQIHPTRTGWSTWDNPEPETVLWGFLIWGSRTAERMCFTSSPATRQRRCQSRAVYSCWWQVGIFYLLLTLQLIIINMVSTTIIITVIILHHHPEKHDHHHNHRKLYNNDIKFKTASSHHITAIFFHHGDFFNRELISINVPWFSPMVHIHLKFLKKGCFKPVCTDQPQ